jgi:hypothetical protein
MTFVVKLIKLILDVSYYLKKTYFSTLKLTENPSFQPILYEKSLLIVVAIAGFISTVAQQKTDSSDKSPKARSNQVILFLIPIKV